LSDSSSDFSGFEMDVDVLTLDSSLQGRTFEYGPLPVVHTTPYQRRLPAQTDGPHLFLARFAIPQLP